MKNQKYEQPKLEFVALEITDILLASTEASETVGALDEGYAVALESATWGEIWGEYAN